MATPLDSPQANLDYILKSGDTLSVTANTGPAAAKVLQVIGTDNKPIPAKFSEPISIPGSGASLKGHSIEIISTIADLDPNEPNSIEYTVTRSSGGTVTSNVYSQSELKQQSKFDLTIFFV